MGGYGTPAETTGLVGYPPGPEAAVVTGAPLTAERGWNVHRYAPEARRSPRRASRAACRARVSGWSEAGDPPVLGWRVPAESTASAATPAEVLSECSGVRTGTTESTDDFPSTVRKGRLSYAVFQLARAHRGYAAAMLREMNLHSGQELLLMQLYERDGQTQSELLTSVGLDHSTVSKALRRMQDAGLLTREPTAHDRRVMVVRLTDKSHAMRKPIAAMWTVLEEILCSRPGLAESFIAIAGTIERAINDRHRVGARDTGGDRRRGHRAAVEIADPAAGALRQGRAAVHRTCGGLCLREGRTCRLRRTSSEPGHPIFVSPRYTVDPLWTFYGQSPRFRRFTAETKGNYATDTPLWLSALCSREKTCLDASPKDLTDFEHWRLGGLPGHRLQGEAGLRRSQAGSRARPP
ncbi:DNA-binding MarR family transcriptional regulator [Streptomyces canus]|nr:DNA-binding MarR family transcriptional regulator [Streptomyces canus]